MGTIIIILILFIIAFILFLIYVKMTIISNDKNNEYGNSYKDFIEEEELDIYLN